MILAEDVDKNGHGWVILAEGVDKNRWFGQRVLTQMGDCAAEDVDMDERLCGRGC